MILFFKESVYNKQTKNLPLCRAYYSSIMLFGGGGVTQKQIFTMNLKKILEWYETKFLKMLLKKIPTDIAIDTPN